MTRLTYDQRRGAIVEAALAVARRKGLATTTVRDVAAEMGTSSGLVHHYFESMDEVLAEAFASAARADLEAVTMAIEAAEGPREAMQAFLDSYAPAEKDWTFRLWLDAWSEAPRRPALRDTSAELNVAWQELVEGVIRAGVKEGVFVSPDPEGSAWRIISLLDGLVLQVVSHRTTLDRPTMAKWARLAIEQELGLDEGTLA